MNPAEGRESITYRFGPYVLDAAERRLFHYGKAVQITPRALDVLTALVRNAGRDVSAEDLMHEAWQGYRVEHNNLAQQISIIRRALSSEGRQYITAIPKRGYRFSQEVVTLAKSAHADSSLTPASRETEAQALEELEDDRPPRRSGLDAVVRFIGLDVYGPPAQRASAEMRHMALLLATVVFYQAVTVAFAVYLLFANGLSRPVAVTFSLAAGAMMGSMLLFLQRSILIADITTDGWKRTLPTLAVRLIILVMMTVWTTTPLEIVLFKAQIDQRLYQEHAMAEALKLYGQMPSDAGGDKTAENRLKLYIQRLSVSHPGEVVEDRDLQLSFRPAADSGLLDNLHALRDIREGTPPQWPPSVKPESLPDWLQNAFNDEGTGHQYRENGDAVRWLSYALMTFGLILPLTSMAFKLLMSPAMALYYSVAFQARLHKSERLIGEQMQEETFVRDTGTGP